MPDDYEKFAVARAVQAVAAMKCKILVSAEDGVRFADHAKEIRDAIVTDYAEACRVAAFVVDRPDHPGAKDDSGWALARLGGGPNRSGHTYDGPSYADPRLFGEAMRMVQDLVRETWRARLPETAIVAGERHHVSYSAQNAPKVHAPKCPACEVSGPLACYVKADGGDDLYHHGCGFHVGGLVRSPESGGAT